MLVRVRPVAGKRDTRLKKVGKDEVKQLAVITQTDIARAQLAWEDIAPVEFKPLLDAVNDPKKREDT